jgi:hypothetical protein
MTMMFERNIEMTLRELSVSSIAELIDDERHIPSTIGRFYFAAAKRLAGSKTQFEKFESVKADDGRAILRITFKLSSHLLLCSEREDELMSNLLWAFSFPALTKEEALVSDIEELCSLGTVEVLHCDDKPELASAICEVLD